MESNGETFELAILLDEKNYQIDNLESEIKADKFCAALLKSFHQHLQQKMTLEPLEAGSQAAGADYFLREFMIGDKRESIFLGTPERVKQFAGNWYIIKNIEPNMPELAAILSGIASFYQFCAEKDLTTSANAEQIQDQCKQLDFFQQRIEDFHDISGDGYSDWNKACPLN